MLSRKEKLIGFVRWNEISIEQMENIKLKANLDMHFWKHASIRGSTQELQGTQRAVSF